jgi:hypothetical protein
LPLIALLGDVGSLALVDHINISLDGAPLFFQGIETFSQAILSLLEDYHLRMLTHMA